MYNVLPVLWRVMSFPYPDIWTMCDKHVIHEIILFVTVIVYDTLFSCIWYQSQFTCFARYLCSASTDSYDHLVYIEIFCSIPNCTALM